jgi:hypothetical protein
MIATETKAIAVRAKRKLPPAELAPMDATEAEAAITRMNRCAAEWTEALVDFAQREGWRSLGYPSLRHCLAERLQIGAHSVYQLLQVAQTRYELAGMAADDNERRSILGLGDNATRTLRRLQDPRRRLEAYRQAVAKVGTNGHGRAVGAAIGRAVRRLVGTRPCDVAVRLKKCPRCQGTGKIEA